MARPRLPQAACAKAGAVLLLATMLCEPMTVVSHRAATNPFNARRSCFGPIINTLRKATLIFGRYLSSARSVCRPLKELWASVFMVEPPGIAPGSGSPQTKVSTAIEQPRCETLHSKDGSAMRVRKVMSGKYLICKSRYRRRMARPSDTRQKAWQPVAFGVDPSPDLRSGWARLQGR